ncbi:hypothetical protein D910_06764 [Dendroctonus ponderosae]|uniref:SAM domain-containing protein n=1 Tax=Dendroctonus ponderosae TaxID=77166 RepID=U4UHP5_DENPD|nr:hypothetical protein D910_06764 [Dendroctonus ponderosae]
MEELEGSNINFVPCIKWVKRGVARANPEKVKLSKEELLEIIKDTKKGFNVAKSEENKNREGVMMGESSSAADEFNFDNYDQNDDDTAGVLGIASLADLPVGTDTTTAFLFESDDSDREDDVIKPTDNLLLVGHVMGDASVLEVHVYNELEESFYVHHDILLNAFPLCLEWLSFEAHRPNGNYCAVGSMSPVIEVWDLDIMNSPRPAYKLGQIASVRKNRAHIGHTDAVLALAGTSTGYVECFDCRKGKLWSFEAHTKEVTGLDISSQCPGLLVTASTETLKTWDFSDENMPKLVNERDFNIGNIQCLELCPDSRFTVAMGGDKKGNSLMVFNMLNIDPGQLHAFDSCSYDDFACLSMAASDKHGLDSIITLHKQLDDDEDGNIDYAESDDFLKEELKYHSGTEKRQKAFHQNNDMHISVKELWEAWLKSEVHNWTVEQTTDWLINNVHLPQYAPNFLLNKVKGANLPRLAVNNANYLGILGIKDPIHKQKISLKAMDVVLFGPPKDGITWKDITLIISAVVVLFGGWVGYQQNKKFKTHMNRMNRDMDSLQNSEQALEKLQKQLEEAKQAEDAAKSEKQNLEKMLQDSKGDMTSLTSAYSESDVTHYKEEIKSLKTQLELTQAAFKNTCYLAPPGLQQWLQLTYELEQKSYDKKKMSAEKQLQQAREACEKLRKKRSSLIGAFVSTHGKAIDDVDRAIVEARSALNEVTYELQEKSHRWRQIELMCGFPITVNIGLQTLENTLYKKHDRFNGFSVRMNSVDDLDMNDDAGSVYGLAPSSYSEMPLHHMASLNEDETSGSENGKQDENANNESKSNDFSFQIGGTSLTQEMNVEEISLAKSAASEGNLESAKARPAAIPEKACLPKKAISIEDDICSTDSSLIEDGEVKKKRRKLFTFSKKSKKGEKSRMSGKVPGNNDKNNDSDSEENSRGPPRSLALDLGDDCVYNVDANRLETQPNASGATGTQERSNPRRDENPFSFRHFLRDCSNGNKNYQSQGARPKVYRSNSIEDPSIAPIPLDLPGLSMGNAFPLDLPRAPKPKAAECRAVPLEEAQIRQLQAENEALRAGNAGATGGEAEPRLEFQTQRLADELKAAASSAEQSLRSLLTGVDNLRFMASTLENFHRIEEGPAERFSRFDDDGAGPAL